MDVLSSVARLKAAFHRRFWVIAVITCIGCVAALWHAVTKVNTYQSTAVIQVQDSAFVGSSASQELRLVQQRLLARDNLLALMEEHQVFADRLESSVNLRVLRMREAIVLEQLPQTADAFGAQPSGLNIHVSLNDPQKAADVANALMGQVVDGGGAQDAGAGRLAFLQTEEQRLYGEIESAEDQIAEFKRANGDQLAAGVASFRTQLANLQNRLEELDRRIQEVQDAPSLASSGDADIQIAAFEEQKSLIERRQRQIQQLISGAPDVERDLNRLERKRTTLQDQYRAIAQRLTDLQLGAQTGGAEASQGFTALESAIAARYPQSRGRVAGALLGILCSVLLALAVAAGLELYRPAVRSAADLQAGLGFKPDVAIPTITLPSDRKTNRIQLGMVAFWAMAVVAVLMKLISGKIELP